VIPTPHLLLALLCVALPLALGAFVAGAQLLAPAVLLAVLAALALDWRATPTPSHLAVRREHEARLSIGAENAVRIHLTNRSRLPLRFQVRDEYPSGLRASAVILEGVVSAGGETQLDTTRSGRHAAATTNLATSTCAIRARLACSCARRATPRTPQ
jgi:uncharacterized protein (DUF58 family)